MGEKSSDEQLAESLRTLLSSDTFKIEPPTVMASSTTLRVRVNVDTLLKLVYDLITRGNVQDEIIGVRYEERSTQTKAKPSSLRGAKGAQSYTSAAVQVDDTSEIEKRKLLERQNQILTRSILQCHAQYTTHKNSCASCPPLTFPQELHDMYQHYKAPPPANPSDPNSTTEEPSISTLPSSSQPLPPSRMPLVPDSSTIDNLVSIAMDVDEDQPPQSHRPSQHANSTHSPSPKRSTSPTPLFSDRASPSRTSPATTSTEHPIHTAPPRQASVQSSYTEASLTPKVEPEDTILVLDISDSPTAPQSREPSFAPKREPEDAMLVVDVPDSPVAAASTASDYMLPLDISDNEDKDTPDPAALDPSEIWWRKEMTELVFDRFLPGTRLLECRPCETRENPSYKCFSDDEENLNAAIQIHYEKEHPEESYVLKRCSNAILKEFHVYR